LRRAGEAFAHERGRYPSQEELSEAAGFTVEEVRFYSRTAATPVSLDALRSDDAGSGSLLDCIADPNAAPDPLEEIEIDERVEWLEECLSEPGFATMSEIDALLDQLHGIPSEASAAGRPHNASTERRHRRTLTRRLKDRAQAEQLVAA
jgi:DNA-directed RNA polymerase sigma subunit (sigma70/sigma32)